MDNKMKKTLILLIAFICIHATGYSQTPDTLYSLSAYLGGGYSYDVASFDYEYDGLNRGGFQGYLRVMWHPEYNLSGGLEFGYTGVYSVEENNIETISGTTDLSTNVYAYPLMLVFSMSIVKNWEVNIGTGLAFSVVKNEAFGESSFSSDGASTSMISTGYYFPVGKDTRLGGELRFTALPKYDDYLITLSLSFAYKFLEY
jgi:hypothetical protein